MRVWTNYSQFQWKELTVYGGHYKHEKQEKKTQSISP